MNNLCHGFRCQKSGTKLCAACGKSCYCSGECQKSDWKIHKLWCADKLPTNALSIAEMTKLVTAAHERVNKLEEDGKCAAGAIIMEMFIIFVEQQFTPGTQRGYLTKLRNGSTLDDMPLYIIRQRLTMLYAADEKFLEALAHALECRKMLELRKDIPGSKNYLYNLFHAESTIHKLYAQLDQLAESQHHGELCVTYAKQLRCEGRVTYLYNSLRGLSGVRQRQLAFPEALALAEEAYELVSGEYGPEHPEVQQASSRVIDCLMSTGELSKADDFARISYESLIAPHNGVVPDSMPHQVGMMQLAEVWGRMPFDPKEDPKRGEEAEEHMRRVCEIAMKQKKPEFEEILSSIVKLSQIVNKRGSTSKQTMAVLRDISAFCMKMPNYGSVEYPLRLAISQFAANHGLQTL
jgi:MYND finger